MSKKLIIPKNSFDNLVKQMDEAGLTEVTYESSFMWGIFKTKSHLSKQQNIMQAAPMTVAATPVVQPVANTAPPVAAAVTNQVSQAKVATGDIITSPMVGVVYFAPETGAKPFIEVGGHVAEGATICLVEAMKTFNPIKAKKSGTVAEILVNNGDTVEFGTPLVVIN